MKQLIECVPNFSEGIDKNVIQQIVREIEGCEGVRLLNVDPGKATNRTVITFVGSPAAVIEAAFLAIRKAGELIDMSVHKGEHPRMGATDVCPLIPIANITLAETAEWAIKLAERVGTELHIPVYLYEDAQKNKSRSNLSVIRAGEYEGFFKKIKLPDWSPDYGPAEMNRKSGATVIGARGFLIAFNVNLNTISTRRANAIAFDVREAGRVKREGDKLTGKIITSADGKPVHIPGSLKCVKAIGWYIKEYGIAQISMNLTNIAVTSMHKAFDEVCLKANERGIRVTGSELVGLVPLQAMTEAGKYFLKKQQRSVGVSEKELVRIAIKSLGLDALSDFIPAERIIEYKLKEGEAENLVDLKVGDFVNETASESPAPGGGSIAALSGAMGVALGTMVANLSSHKKGWDERWELYSQAAEKGQKLKDQFLRLVDEDTNAFNQIMDAFTLPKGTQAETDFRRKQIQLATRQAMEIPLQVMAICAESMEIVGAMAETGNPNSISDAGVGAICLGGAVRGAYLNVKINARGCDDKDFVLEKLKLGGEYESAVLIKEKQILEIVERKINSN